MASRQGPVHVVRNVRKHGDKVYESYLLRRSVRVGKKVEKKSNRSPRSPQFLLKFGNGRFQGHA